MPRDSRDINSAYGICFGASTITAVQLSREKASSPGASPRPTIERTVVRPHNGNPKETALAIIDELDPGDAPVLATGRKLRELVLLPTITEPEATELALDHVNTHAMPFDALVSAGGETFMVYLLDREGKIATISTGNKCASGTGEFFLQQIRRMDLGIEEATLLAETGTPYAVSGRCSVFCKSDCTHALNKGEPIANVTAGLCRMIANRILEILARGPHERVIMVGGTARNQAVSNYLRGHIDELLIPEEAPYFEALGAAIAAFDRGRAVGALLFIEGKSAFSYLPPLRDSADLVRWKQLERVAPVAGDRCLVGLDVGSTTTKAVLICERDEALLASVYLRTNGNPVEASRACFRSLLSQIHDSGLDEEDLEIVGVATTGSGRQIAGLFALTDTIVNEIIAHAAAAVYFDPEVDTIFEIGGQDAKYTHLTAGVASDYAMNEACSAGTGSFLEEAAYESLGVATEEIAELALLGSRPPNFNDQCAAFISSDIKNAVHEGITRNDILAGLVYSICFNYANRVKGNRPVGRKVFLQGGVCYNSAVPLAMAAILGKEIVVPPEPGLMGAYGAALEMKKRLELGVAGEARYLLGDIAARSVEHGQPFVCNGGPERCDLKCEIARIRIDGKVYPFGGACNRYYNLIHKTGIRGGDALDLIRVRNRIFFEDFAPHRDHESKAPVVGLVRSFLTLRMFPLYYNFFSLLGSRIVVSDGLVPEAANRKVTSMCFPAEVSLMSFENLLGKRPDFVFIPHAKELYVPGGIERTDFCATCAFSQGEAFWLRGAYRDRPEAGRLIAPTVSFNGGWEHGRTAFVEAAAEMGFDRAKARQAFDESVRMQYAAEEALQEEGRRVLDELHEDPERTAIVVFGRPYNAYAPEANKGIPRKLTSRGQLIIPYEMLPYGEEPLGEEYGEYMHWEAGQRILRAARIVRRDPQLYGLYITNFLCAPDSFLVSFFRQIMGQKPSLTLELDAHTADAGINTRIEAFVDIVRNYRRMKSGKRLSVGPAPRDGLAAPPNAEFRPAEIRFEHNGIVYVDSSGKRFRATDPEVRLVLPPMGELGPKFLSAAVRRAGINSEALPVADREVMRYGRNATSCKECLPMMVCIGSLLRYLNDRPPERWNEKLMILIPQAAGYCRLGQYAVYTRQYIRRQQIPDVAVLNLGMEEGYGGLGPTFAIHGWKAIVAADILDDVVEAIRALAVDRDAALEVFGRETDRILDCVERGSWWQLLRQLRESARVLKEIPLKQSYEKTATVAVTGEFFVRKDPFSNLGLARRLAEQGFLVKTATVIEWLYYVNYQIEQKLIEPKHTIASWLDFHLRDSVQRHMERRMRRIFAASGLYDDEKIDVADLIRHSEHILPKTFAGEPGLIAGTILKEGLSHYCGVINVGPFGCMQTRFADAITAPHVDLAGKHEAVRAAASNQDLSAFPKGSRIPYLAVESDGNPYPQLLEARFESFCLQAARAAERRGFAPAAGTRSSERGSREPEAHPAAELHAE